MLKNKVRRQFKKTEKGMAFVESIPVLFMVVVVFNFSLGFFGAIHSGILNSIASYNYTMETFRFRSNLIYFRPGDTKMANYSKAMARVHGITSDGSPDDDVANGQKNKWPVTVRAIAFNKDAAHLSDGETVQGIHDYKDAAKNDSSNVWGINSKYSPDSKDGGAKSPEIWVKTVYGICLNAECKP